MTVTNLSGIDSAGWDIQRRSDGALLVRVPSAACGSRRLPDAVFTFRAGDPQYAYWEQQWRQREGERIED
jgi:hypothetical protein